MTTSAPQLDDLVALNQEIAALIRAGIPLEIGLKQHADSWPSRFAGLAERISQRLALGESLVAALREEGPAISPAYAAVVEAGLQSGRLPEALEDLAKLGMTIQEVRRRVWVSAVYPLIVCSLAYGMFVWFIKFGVPLWTQTRDAMFLPPRPFFNLLAGLHDTVNVWGPLIPALILTFVIVQMIRAASGSTGSWRQIVNFLWIPGIGALYRHMLRAQFARLLSVLVEHQIPAGRAVMLAADSTGDLQLQASALGISEQLQRGATWGQAVSAETRLPQFLQWMMVVGDQEQALASVMQQTADAYQRKADRWLTWVRSVLPMLLVTLLCGGVVLVYCVGLFIPMQQFWYDLMEANR